MDTLQLQKSYASYDSIFHPYSKKQTPIVADLEGFDNIQTETTPNTEAEIYEQHLDNNFDVYLDNDNATQYIDMINNPNIVTTKKDENAKCKMQPWTTTTHFYVGSLTVVGLFILFRVIQKSK